MADPSPEPPAPPAPKRRVPAPPLPLKVRLKKHLTLGAIIIIVTKELLIVHPADMTAEFVISVVADMVIKPIVAWAGVPIASSAGRQPHE